MNLNPVRRIEELNSRLMKAYELVDSGAVEPVLERSGHYVVKASKGGRYVVENGKCVCQDAVRRTDLHRGNCKHLLAVLVHEERQQALADAPEVKWGLEDLYPVAA